ncbi:hypothetical protein [Streptosporangium subroseum]|uniref:hypothetical protein n=1 Tax=Streptosporangium subroseum TaxID=106412 RepID=UPI00308AA86C|nr:hypothetical protein OHB15_27535 [Streptosporangium subroseum]
MTNTPITRENDWVAIGEVPVAAEKARETHRTGKPMFATPALMPPKKMRCEQCGAAWTGHGPECASPDTAVEQVVITQESSHVVTPKA